MENINICEIIIQEFIQLEDRCRIDDAQRIMTRYYELMMLKLTRQLLISISTFAALKYLSLSFLKRYIHEENLLFAACLLGIIQYVLDKV